MGLRIDVLTSCSVGALFFLLILLKIKFFTPIFVILFQFLLKKKIGEKTILT